MTQEQFDRLTQYLISNGDVPAVVSQRIYEYAWSQGIRPLRESALKPEGLVRKRKRPAERQPGHRSRGFSVLRAMKRECDPLDIAMQTGGPERVEEELPAGWWARGSYTAPICTSAQRGFMVVSRSATHQEKTTDF